MQVTYVSTETASNEKGDKAYGYMRQKSPTRWQSKDNDDEKEFYICEIAGQNRLEIQKEQYLTKVAQACDFTPCFNGGTCHQNALDATKYTCECTDRFAGHNCQFR